MSVHRAARLALLAYPPSFRERYGAELAGLVEDRGGGSRGDVLEWRRPRVVPTSAQW